MKRPMTLRFALITASAATVLAAAPPLQADDTELFYGDAVAATPSEPNIMFILDTSGSMSTQITTQEDWDPNEDWDGNCADDRIYWSRNQSPPSCNTQQYIDATSFTCNAAAGVLASNGIAYVNRAGQNRWQGYFWWGQYQWRDIASGNHDDFVECQDDAGIHGEDAASSAKWAANANQGPWSSNQNDEINWNARGGYYFFTGNYINWQNGSSSTKSRLRIMQDVAGNVLDQLSGVNVGLMRYSNDGGGSSDDDAEGGMVIVPVGPVASNRDVMKAAINSWNAAGWTPLSETLYEATQYFRGGDVVWGETSDVRTSYPNGDTPSVAESRDPSDSSRYQSPMTGDCQKNFIVYLTDGLPTQDNQSNSAIQNLPGFRDVVGSGTCDIEPNLQYNNSGRCTDDLAKWLHESDLRPDLPGLQNVTSYYIGFGDDVRTGSQFLEEAAQRGGGQFYTAEDSAELAQAFTDIISRILSQSVTFTAPTVAVNAFNRTQNLNYLYMSLFEPATTYRWQGNIKKYRVTPAGVIVDAEGNAAVNPNTGFFYDSTRSYWSTASDGSDATAGGAASRITSPATRTVYSNLTSATGLLSEELSELKDSANLALANQLLLGVTSSVAVPDRPAVDALVDWAYGYDILDVDGDNNTSEGRKDMGDPLHARPATVIYGGTAASPDITDITLYGVTNDGYLQAIDAETGNELWSFIPSDLLHRIEPLLIDNTIADREYGLDGSIRTIKLDRNNDGIVDSADGDRVLLYFGMRRGGFDYFALDVTNRNAPVLLWQAGPAELPGVGQTWSTPAVARVNINRNWGSNTDKLVLLVGGGYDPSQDSISYTADAIGNHVFMIDAISGALIWRAGPTGDTGAQLRLAKMTNSIPSDVRSMDMTGDGFTDRMYVADTGGRIFRFDIKNGETPANLVVGGVFASLGVADTTSKPDSGNRRFFYAPDVALINKNGSNWLNIGIGSGHRALPITDQTVVNRFYSLRDYNLFATVESSQYKATCSTSETLPCHEIITDGDLVDVSSTVSPTIPSQGVGWKMNLQDLGEKVLAESRTFQNNIYFTTYSPQQRAYNAEFCVATVGLNRLYVVGAAEADPVQNFDASTAGPSSVSDRFKELAQGSIAPEVLFVFPTPDVDPNNPNAPPPAVPPFCLVGLESCGTGMSNPPVRTYWQERSAN